MAHTRQAIKRLRTNEEKHIRNHSLKSEIKTKSKKAIIAAADKSKDDVSKLLSEIYSRIDKAVKFGVLHKKTAARKKSRVSQAVKKIQIAKKPASKKK